MLPRRALIFLFVAWIARDALSRPRDARAQRAQHAAAAGPAAGGGGHRRPAPRRPQGHRGLRPRQAGALYLRLADRRRALVLPDHGRGRPGRRRRLREPGGRAGQPSSPPRASPTTSTCRWTTSGSTTRASRPTPSRIRPCRSPARRNGEWFFHLPRFFDLGQEWDTQVGPVRHAGAAGARRPAAGGPLAHRPLEHAGAAAGRRPAGRRRAAARGAASCAGAGSARRPAPVPAHRRFGLPRPQRA